MDVIGVQILKNINQEVLQLFALVEIEMIVEQSTYLNIEPVSLSWPNIDLSNLRAHVEVSGYLNTITDMLLATSTVYSYYIAKNFSYVGVYGSELKLKDGVILEIHIDNQTYIDKSTGEEMNLSIDDFRNVTNESTYTFRVHKYLSNPDCPYYNYSCIIYGKQTGEYVTTYNSKWGKWIEKIIFSNSKISNVTWTLTDHNELIENSTDVLYKSNGHRMVTAASIIPLDDTLQPQFIICSDIDLSIVESYLNNFFTFTNGYAFIMDSLTGEILVSSFHVPGSFGLTNNVAITQQKEIENSAKFVVEFCSVNFCTDVPMPVHNDGEMVVISGTRNYTDFFNWTIVFVVSEDTYTGNFYSYFTVNIVTGFSLLLLCSTFSILALGNIIEPLEKCTLRLKLLAGLDFVESVEPKRYNSNVIEISRIYDSLFMMHQSLQSFARYVPPDIVRLLMKSGSEASLTGEYREMTFFFSDIKNFTTITEKLDIDKLIDILCDYLEEMSSIIQDNEGTVDKYIGDAIMGIWNAPDVVIDHAKKACEAALLCDVRLKALNRTWAVKGYPEITARIGLHTGTAIVGNFGSKNRLNYTALGDAVNLASRLESLNKQYGTQIMISEKTYNLVKDTFIARPLDQVAVKGKNEAVCVYELVTHVHTATPEEFHAVKIFTKGFELYQAGKFASAKTVFEKYLTEVDQHDKPAIMHIKSCEDFINNPPDMSEWHGYRKMTSK